MAFTIQYKPRSRPLCHTSVKCYNSAFVIGCLIQVDTAIGFCFSLNFSINQSMIHYLRDKKGFDVSTEDPSSRISREVG